ncbi:hypothetical protein DPMN_157856 [Dreissena polymorpha]|uniref:Uncharacterized protein n=1 Tax=Dreissena polymorpha TaxID=45954 RepID=A0A9D4EHZ8_DREPO|nr:hypothetical protein DPMN_157856 [Dreissena polymorpha]
MTITNFNESEPDSQDTDTPRDDKSVDPLTPEQSTPTKRDPRYVIPQRRSPEASLQSSPDASPNSTPQRARPTRQRKLPVCMRRGDFVILKLLRFKQRT